MTDFWTDLELPSLIRARGLLIPVPTMPAPKLRYLDRVNGHP